VRLVDVFGNPLDETSDAHDVQVSADLGRLLGSVERDPTQGFYTIELQATRKPGTATVDVTVDGTGVGSATVQMVGESCQCAHGRDRRAPTGAWTALAALALALARGRR
jgi:MYXO-CTERM domain-containing protein